MLFFFALTCLAAATVGSVYVYQRGVAGRLPAGQRAALPARAAKEDDAPARADATLDTLAIGDVVQDGDVDFVVEGVVRYREERDTWAVFFLEGGSAQRWLEVKKRGGVVEAAFLEVVTDAPLFGSLGAGLTYRGRPFAVAARGDARTHTEGVTPSRASGALKYARYAGPGGESLVIEEETQVKRAWLGRAVPASSLSILGGELVRARDDA